jgi:rhodanese-related sulfurtransferase
MDPHFDGVIFQTHAAELRRRIRRPHPPFAVLDVRGNEAWRQGRIPGAVPAGELTALPDGVAASAEIFVVGSGPDDQRVRAASLRLRELGARRVVELTGGMSEWGDLRLALERGEPRAAA